MDTRRGTIYRRLLFSLFLLLIFSPLLAQRLNRKLEPEDIPARRPQRRKLLHRRPKHAPPTVPAEEDDRPAQREDWFRAGRQSTAGAPAAALRHSAVRRKIQSEAILKKYGAYSSASGTTVPAAQWQELGPRPQSSIQFGNVAGRITAIAVDMNKDSSGNTVYIGTAYGGLWKSTDGLAVNPIFMPLTENAATLSAGAIAIDSSATPSTLYIGTGEPDSSIDSYYGVGIMKSTDDGQNWSVVSTADNGGESFYGQSFSKLLVDEVYPNILVACTRLPGTPTFRNLQPGIYRSTDSGQTWNLIYTTPYGCSDLVYQRSTHTYFAALNGSGLLASTATGAAWVQIGNPIVSGAAPSINNLKRIALATRNSELWALMVDGNGNLSTPVPCPSGLGPCDTGLSLSTDGGHTFTALPAPPTAFGTNNQGWYDIYFAAPGNTGTVLLGGVDLWSGAWNGSASIGWTNLTQGYNGGPVHPDQHAFFGLDESRWYIGNDGGIWTTQNAGATWTNANQSIGAIQFTSVSVDTQITGQYFGGSQDNGTALGAPSNSNWTTIFPGDGGETLASKQVPSRYLTENYNVSLRRSNDRGSTFQTVVDSNTINEYSSFYVPYEFTDATESSLLLGTCRIWRGPVAAINGAGWVPISGDLSNTNSCGSYITALAIAPSTPDVVYAVTRNGNVWQTLQATAPMPNWSVITAPPIPQRPLSAVAIDPNDPTNVFVAAQGFDTGHIFRRSNGNWVDISGNLPNVPVNSIVVDPQHPLNIYAATDAGIYMASDGGTPQSGWQLVGTHLPNVAVVELKITSGSPRALLAATHGRGAWTLPIDAPSALGAPALQSPANGATAAISGTQFIWTPVPGADSYVIMVTTNPNNLPTDPAATSCPGCTISVTASSNAYASTISLIPNTPYTWQVRALNSTNGQNGAWSARSIFTAGYTPDNLSFLPNVLNFGNNGVFSVAAQTVQVTNLGTTPALLNTIAVQDMRNFGVTSNCPVTLQPSASCLLNLTFSPQFVGLMQTQLTLTNTLNGTSHSLPVIGSGLYALTSLNATSLNFGRQALNADSPSKRITITNPGNMMLLFGMSFAGDFRGSTDCGVQLAPGASCTTTITFHPAGKGLRTGNLTLIDNTALGTHTVTLTGRGDPLCGKQSDGSNIPCAKPVITP